MPPSIKESHSFAMDNNSCNENESESSSEEEQSAENSSSADDSSEVEDSASVPQLPNRQQKRKYDELQEASENPKKMVPCGTTHKSLQAFAHMIGVGLRDLSPDLAIECIKEMWAVHCKFQLQQLNKRSALSDINTEHS